MRQISAGVLCALGPLLLGMSALCEVLLMYPAPWWLSLLVTIVFAVAILVSLKGGAHRATPAIAFLGIVIAWALYLIPWSTRKPFLRDLNRIQVGMSESDVREIMSGYMEGTGWTFPNDGEQQPEGTLNDLGSGQSYPTETADGQLSIKDSIVFRHSNDGAYNADWGIVRFENGRVVSVDFSAD